MADDLVKRVQAHPAYQELKRRRGRARLGFFLVMCVIYFGFILTLAFRSEVFAAPLYSGATITVGIVVAVLVAISAMVLIAGYVYLSGKKFDPLLEIIVRDVK
ncbi:Protein of unknown function DUF485 [gamma proteobacterium HdN1]|nr:Protein of unknown function DUF485 [gamma proteobacterium HdN1]